MNKPPKLTLNNTDKTKPIESYLFTPPKKAQVNVNLSIKNKVIEHKKITKTKVTKKTPNKPLQQKATNVSKIKNATLKENIKPKEINPSLPTKLITKHSLNAQLKNIEKYIPHQETAIRQRSNIKSIFNPNPKLVPKSSTLSIEQIETQRKQRITNYGNSMFIEKNDNGNCKMTQDLSSVGIEGVSAIQHFKCGGKTQFERRFSEHMKEAIQRYK